jgi:hypothetical protein
MKKTVLSSLILILGISAMAGSAYAQRETQTGYQVEKDLELLRRDLQADKKKIIAMNVPMTETEATKFWPVYETYAAAMKAQYDQFYALIKDYAANQKTITDTQASDLVKRWADIQVQVAQTRQKFVPEFAKVLPGRKAALFMQIDRRLYELIDLQVASEVPLVPQ